MTGSAPEALGWVGLEQPGAWGAKAWTASGLDPVVGAAIEARAATHRIRPVLVRRPGRRRSGRRSAERRVLVAHSTPGATWLLSGAVSQAVELLSLDWAAVARGDAMAAHQSLPGLEVEHDSVLLVCANGKRDECCAVLGRPVAAAVEIGHPGRVWETTHLSGHRFAPTAVSLPSGFTYGRLGPDSAGEVLAAADRGEAVVGSARGRSAWPADGQTAELAVRAREQITGLDEIVAVSSAEIAGAWIVRHRDGRAWEVEVAHEETGRLRPESCAKAPVPLRVPAIRGVRLLA